MASITNSSRPGSLPIVSFSTDKAVVPEGDTYNWIFNLDRPVPIGGLTVTVYILDNNDPAPGDINFFLAGSVNVTGFQVVRENGAAVAFRVTLAEGVTEARLLNRSAIDLVDDVDEVATFALASGSNYAVSPTQNQFKQILDDPIGTPTTGAGGIPSTTPIVSFTADKTIVSEGETFTWTFTLNQPAPVGGLSLILPILNNNDPAPGDVAYNIAGGSNVAEFETVFENGILIGFRVTVAAGATSATVVSRAIADTNVEIDETYTTALAQGSNYVVAPNANQVSLTIIDTFPNTNDTLFGTDAAETLNGGGGNDTIYGNGGADTLIGGIGSDKIYGGSHADHISGGNGNDKIYGNGGLDTLVGGSGSDTIYGGSQSDTILGGAGNDVVYANGGGDFINTESGFDTVWLGGVATVVLEAGAGFDTIKNFQLGVTQFQVSSTSNLSFADSADGVRISQNSDLLAVVSWQTASTFSNNVGSIFTV